MRVPPVLHRFVLPALLLGAFPTSRAADDPARLARIRAAKMPAITAPVMFNTPEADAILTALEVFPPDNPWNQLVTDWPVHARSKEIVSGIGDAKPLRVNPDMAFILVPSNQPLVELAATRYAGESDKGPFPIPAEMPIEGWPAQIRRDARTRDLTLEDVQADKLKLGGDRHGIVVDSVRRLLFEFYTASKKDGSWTVSQSSKFDLKSNALRPAGWTSSDAAGLPIFPSIVRFDELQRGVIDHALRVTVRRTRRAYVAPATHYASKFTDLNLPRMGERLRLRQDFDVSTFSPNVRTILTALKRYGMLVADNGIEWAVSMAPDERIPPLGEELRKVKGSDFEVVVAPGSPKD